VTNSPQPASSEPTNDLDKMRFDYAWKWFDFHAKQRTSLFNFYIIVIAATIGAVGALTRTDAGTHAGDVIDYLCWFAIVVSVIFLLLDRRNKRLVQYGELNLVHLEKNYLFKDNAETVYYEGQKRPLGLLKQEYFRNKSDDTNDAPTYYDKPGLISHGKLIPGTMYLVILLFLILQWVL
jgi:hypothetical protein